MRPHGPHGKFVRIALVLPTEFAYARDVLHGVVAATRERNLYGRSKAAAAADPKAAAARERGDHGSWQFRVFRGIYTSSTFLGRWFKDWEPDGIICQIQEDQMADFFRGTGKPVVEVFERNGAAQFPRILPDDHATGRMAAEHFLRRGFRHFGYFGDGSMAWVSEREAGFREEIERAFTSHADADADDDGSGNGSGSGSGSGNGNRDAGRGFSLCSFENTNPSVAAALGGRSHRRQSAAMGEWLASLPRPVAVLAANDLWGFELVQAAREAGLHVPDDVAILGVDNDELLCEISHPPLSSIRIGGEQMGQAAVAAMERLLAGRPVAAEQPRVPPLGVVTRQSSDVLAVDDPEVAAALRHIRGHAFEGLSVKQLLDAVAVNRRTLERRFVKVLGHTPLEEIRRVRLERVKALLQTDLPIHEVAARAGFASPEYLATSFLQSTGMTPSDYRRKFAPRGRWHHLPP
ncbi:MAG TPA: substrate-binding domain-containing protein [Tepidisphaeraceae bacterium]|nr:substrate-binding domain-containing protein [Tepidisphaeraceae bacterium]